MCIKYKKEHLPEEDMILVSMTIKNREETTLQEVLSGSI